MTRAEDQGGLRVLADPDHPAGERLREPFDRGRRELCRATRDLEEHQDVRTFARRAVDGRSLRAGRDRHAPMVRPAT